MNGPEKHTQILITNIQRFSLHDGPGIRTTVFLKGCSLRCPWCSNPENLIPEPQPYTKEGITGVYGKYYSAEDLVQECLKDRSYYTGQRSKPSQWAITKPEDIDRLPGGVTFSGGEPLLQMKNLVPVCEKLHQEGIHLAVETSLFVSQEDLSLALQHIDFFFVDVKILDESLCRSVEKGNLGQYLDNLEYLLTWTDQDKHRKPVIIRIPVIGTMTDDVSNRKRVHDLLHQYNDGILKIELIKEHNLGESKYKSIDRNFYYHGVEDQLMESYLEELSDLGKSIEICRNG